MQKQQFRFNIRRRVERTPRLVKPERRSRFQFVIVAQSSQLSRPEITVEPGAKNLEVRFTSPVSTAPDLIRFKYRLDKFDADWIDLGGQKSVTSKQVPAGEYTFRVTTKNSDGL